MTLRVFPGRQLEQLAWNRLVNCRCDPLGRICQLSFRLISKLWSYRKCVRRQWCCPTCSAWTQGSSQWWSERASFSWWMNQYPEELRESNHASSPQQWCWWAGSHWRCSRTKDSYRHTLGTNRFDWSRRLNIRCSSRTYPCSACKWPHENQGGTGLDTWRLDAFFRSLTDSLLWELIWCRAWSVGGARSA